MESTRLPIKDYLRPQEQQITVEALKSIKNPNGRDRKNRLNRDFEKDLSIRMGNKNKSGGESWSPHDYL